MLILEKNIFERYWWQTLSIGGCFVYRHCLRRNVGTLLIATRGSVGHVDATVVPSSPAIQLPTAKTRGIVDGDTVHGAQVCG
jgi:hypothetical protein